MMPQFKEKINRTKNILKQIEANNDEIKDLKEQH